MSTPVRRPRKLEQPDVVWTLLDALGRGESLPAALRTAGVAPSTFYRERRQSTLLRGLIEHAEAAGRERRAIAVAALVATPAATEEPPIEVAAAPPIEAPSPQIEAPAAPQIEALAAPQIEAPAAPQIEGLAAPQIEAHAAPQIEAHAAPQIEAPIALPVEPSPDLPVDVMPVGPPRPVERPNVAGLLERLASRRASRTMRVTVERRAPEPRPPIGELAAERRTAVARLVHTLTSASRVTARERQESVHVMPHAEERPGGSDGLPPQVVLILQLVVAVLFVGNLSLPLGIAAVAIAYFLAFRRPDTAAGRFRQARPIAVAVAEEPVEASHDLRWLDATLARRPPITKDK